MPLVLALVLALFVNACSSTPAPSGTTFGQLAQTGKTVFASRCAKCHGDSGQGVTAPAIIGASASLDKYNTAQGLLNFIDTAMPMNAPGILSQQEYSQVLSFLLVQNNFTPSDKVFDASNLGNIPLKR